MYSAAFAIYSLLILEISRASIPNLNSDHAVTLYRGVMDIFSDSPNAPSLKLVGLISDDTEEFIMPVKMLHEFERTVVVWQNEPTIVDCTFVEVKYRKGDNAGDILADILPRVAASHTVVFILRNPEEFYLDEIEAFMVKVFQEFWKELMTNVAIAFLNIYKNSSPSFRVLTYVYEPYNSEPLRNVTGQKYRGTFYNKAANLHLHPLKVLAHEKDRLSIETAQKGLESSGIDSQLTKILGQMFNATIELTYNVKMGLDLHHKLTKIVKLYNNGSIDLWMHVHIIKSDRHHEVTFTYPMQQTNVVCILPKNRDRRVKYKSVGGGRVVTVTLVMSVLFSVMSIFVYLNNVILKNHFSILKLPKLLANQSDAVVQKSSSTTIRVLLGTWIIISLACSTLLQTLITSRIIRPSVDDRLTKIEEVIDSNFRLRIELSYWKLTKDHYDKDILEGIGNDIEVVENGELFEVEDPDVGYIAAEYTGRFIRSRSSQFYVLQQVFLPNYIGYYFPKNSPLLLRFNTALASVTETGVLAKWLAESHRRSLNNVKTEDRITSTNYITYKNLTSVIYLYCICMLLAFVVFVCELKFQRLTE